MVLCIFLYNRDSDSGSEETSAPKMPPKLVPCESVAYNKFPICDVLKRLLGGRTERSVSVLELGSGTAEHAIHMVDHVPAIGSWQPTEVQDELDVTKAWVDDDHKKKNGASLIRAPHALSFTDPPEVWKEVTRNSGQSDMFDVVFTANTQHIAPWDACLAFYARLPLVLKRGGLLVMYGPFNVGGQYTTESNKAFDAWLKVHKSPQSALRNYEDIVAQCAALGGLTATDSVEMPDNNKILVFTLP